MNNDKRNEKATLQEPAANVKSPAETHQEQADPNLTELKGLIDPDEELEPKGTDNDFGDKE